jgi:hypothetical protein
MKCPCSCLVFLLALLSLSGCGGVRESLGLGRNPPDEFAVIDRPPLSMPPDFGLRPPTPGVPSRQDINTQKRASEVVFGSSSAGTGPAVRIAAENTSESESERSLLEATGVKNADPDIRAIVDREDSEKVVTSRHLVEDLLWWKPEAKPGVTVDAAAEAKRIKEAKERGSALNNGATPIIEREKTGWLGL